MEFSDFTQAVLLGAGLAMDAASVSMSNGMIEKKMKIKKMIFIAFMFAFFQGMMPLIGYFLGSIFTDTIAKYVPYIGFTLLSFLGIKMLIDCFKNEKEDKKTNLTFTIILLQAIATSIDALTTGIIYIKEKHSFVLMIFTIVAITTFIISFIALYLGKKFGELLNKYAIFIGGIILISIGFKLLLETYFYIYLLVLFTLFILVSLYLIIKNNRNNNLKLVSIIKDINDYIPVDEKENEDKKLLLNLLKEKKFKAFSRKNEDIHMTSSAIVLNESKDKVLFCFHNIYNSWSWLGGHADNEIDLKAVAIKEVQEETGLKEFKEINNPLISLEILPVKKHIKNNKEIKAHKHANVTYVFIASEDSKLIINEKENSGLKFIEISKIEDYVSEKHMIAIYKKIFTKIEKEKIAN